jgi:hypothetical protein
MMSRQSQSCLSLSRRTRRMGRRSPSPIEQQTLNAQMKVKHGESLERFLIAKEKAASDIFAHLSRSQHVHIKGIEDDPNTYNELFGIVKGAEESLPSVVGCVSKSLIHVQSLHPSGFTLETLDNKLALMAMLRALPRDQYSNFVLSLMRQKKLKQSEVEAAFQIEQTEHDAICSPLLSISNAVLRTTDTAVKSDTPCKFCSILGHVEEKCYKYTACHKDTQAVLTQKHQESNGAAKARKA